MDRRLNTARTTARRLAAAPSHASQAVMRVATTAAITIVAATPAWASGPAMPWDGPLANILDNLSGRTARVLVLLAIVGCGLTWAFTRNEEGLKKLSQIAFGGTIAMTAVGLLTALGIAAGAAM